MTKLSQKSHENVSPASYDRLKYTGKGREWGRGNERGKMRSLHKKGSRRHRVRRGQPVLRDSVGVAGHPVRNHQHGHRADGLSA